MEGRTRKGKELNIALILLLLFSATACTPKDESDEEDVPTVESPVANGTAEPDYGEKIGFIERLVSRVTVRRKRELVWQEAPKDYPLFAFDAVHTDEQATARLSLNNGSQLDMMPSTLVILNPSAFNSAEKKDRAIVRDGHLTGRTRGELWILTSAALLKLKPKSKTGMAQASITLAEGKKIQITLNDGQGELIRTKEVRGKSVTERIALKANRLLSLPAPKLAENFGQEPAGREWQTGPAVVDTPGEKTKPPKRMPTPSRPVASMEKKPITLTIHSPRGYSEVEAESVQVKGRLSGVPKWIRVNGESLQLDGKNEFSIKVPLKLGANPILVEFAAVDDEPAVQRLIVRRKR